MRNYKKEYDWGKNKYDEIRFKIPKDEGIKFRTKLSSSNVGLTEWGKRMIDEYLKEQ